MASSDPPRPKPSTVAMTAASVWRTCWRIAGWLALVLTATTALAAGTSSPWDRWRELGFEQLTVAGGLPHATTTSFAQASDGALWIGTFGGLVRYDGYRTQVFRQADDDRGLPDNYVRALAAAADGSVLVATTSGGLARFDPHSNLFLRYDASPRHGTGTRIFSLAPDNAGGFWIAGQNGLTHLRADLRTLERPAGIAPAITLFSVREDHLGNVWAGTAHGLYVRRHGEQVFRRFATSDDAARAVLATDIWALREDSHGNLWVGTGSAGVAVIDPQSEAHVPAALAADSPAIQHRTVRDILPAPDGRLWVATDGVGIARFDPATDTASVLRHDPGRPSSLGGNIVRALFLDRSGGLWAATESTASRFDTRPSIVHTLDGSAVFGPGGAQIDQNVRSVFTDRAGRVWLGFNRGHVAMVDTVGGRIRTLELDGAQADQDIRAIAQLDDGRIVAGARGLVTIDPDTLTVRPYPVPGLDGRPVLALATYRHDLLVGTYNGLFRIGADGHVKVFRHEAGDPDGLVDDQVRNIVPLPDGKAWIATANGLSILSSDDRFETLRNVPGDAGSLPQNYLGSIVQVGADIWIGTYGGLAETPLAAAPGGRRFTVVRARNGLGSDNIAAVLPDGHGRLWAATADGLSVYDPATGQARTLGLRDGLGTRFYNHRTAAPGPNGELMFGGLDGLTVIQPDAELSAGQTDAPLAVTAVMADEHAVPFARLPTPDRALELPGGLHSLRIRFALLDYTAGADVRYSYRLEGFDEHWIALDSSARPGTIYTNLPGGHYVLHLRAAIPGLHAHVVETALPLTIAPLWWERVWVRLGLVLLAVLLVLGVMQLRTHYLHRQASELGRLVRERTSELQAANEQLHRLASTDELTGLLNRRALMQRLEHEHAEAQRHRLPLSIVMLDLDAFKALNDRYGHLAGDDALRGVATIVGDCCRSIDHVGRYGGEEIMVVLVHADLDTAMPVAERIRSAIAATGILHGDSTIRLTASIGVATLLPGERPQSFIARADAALYRAKRAGRNAVELAEA